MRLCDDQYQIIMSSKQPCREEEAEQDSAEPIPSKRPKLDEKDLSTYQLASVLEEKHPGPSNDDDRTSKTERHECAESDDPADNVRSQFLVDLPEDFYLFWDFCKSLDQENPSTALRSALGLDLTGPYDVLSGRLRGMPSDKCVLHSRHYYDPPEMTTVLTMQRTDEGLGSCVMGFHMGYFRDDPKTDQYLVVSNDSSQGCELVIEGSNIFSAVRQQVLNKLQDKKTLNKKGIQANLMKLDSGLDHFLSNHKSISCVVVKDLRKRRSKAIVGMTLNKMGIIVPYDKKTELGYRSLPLTKREMQKLLQKISSLSGDESAQDKAFEPLQEVVTFVQFANDECDYGMGLELGMDLFCYGDPYLHSVISHLLLVAYDLLQREPYGKICRLHLKQRGRTPLSLLPHNVAQ